MLTAGTAIINSPHCAIAPQGALTRAPRQIGWETPRKQNVISD